MKKQGSIYGLIMVSLLVLFLGGLSLVQAAARNFMLVNSGQLFAEANNPRPSVAVAVGDLDNDGNIDAFIVNSGSQTDEAWFNKGTGLFDDSGLTFDTSENADGRAAALGDLNKDGWLDIFVASNLTNTIWLNNKDRTFTRRDLVLKGNGRGVALGDFNKDGRMDAFVANDGPNTVWLNNNASAVLIDSGQRLGNENSAAVVAVDFNGDTNLDVLVVNGDSSGNKIWLNNGTAVFTNSSNVVLGTTIGRAAATGDLNGDGKLDVFIANNGADTVWLSRGNGTFTDTQQALGTDDSYGVALADIDSDGDLDAYVANEGNDQIWLNDGKGIFTAGPAQTDNVATRGVVMANFDGAPPVLVDTNNDGKTDITLPSTDNDPDVFMVNFNQSSQLLLNMDKGQVMRVQMTPQPNGFKAAVDTPLLVPFANDVDLTSGDMFVQRMTRGAVKNGLKIVGSKTISWTHTTPFRASEWVHITTQSDLGKYQWSFLTTVKGGLGRYSPAGIAVTNSDNTHNDRAVAMGDIDGDGDIDAFVGVNGANRLLLNSGFGQFTVGQSNMGAEDSRAVALGDVDNDGDLDAFVANYGANSQLWLNNNGTFANSNQVLLNSNSQAVALGDLNNDGFLDAVVGNGAKGTNPAIGQPDMVFYNNGQGVFDTNKSLGDSSSAHAIALADFNADGYLDAYIANDFGDPSEANRFDQLWLNDGQGNLVKSKQVLQGTEKVASQSVTVGDLNKDGFMDVVVGVNGNNLIWLNNGPKDGYRLGKYSALPEDRFVRQKYLANQTLFTPSDTRAIGLGDIDDDGDLDLIETRHIPTTNEANIKWYNQYNAASNDKNTIFVFDKDFSNLTLPGTAAVGTFVGDLDNDGDVDIFILNEGTDYAYLNRDDLQPIDTMPPTVAALGNGTVIMSEQNVEDVVSVTFNRGISQATVTNKTFIINGQQGGYYAGTYPAAPISTTIQFRMPPLSANFFAGESVFASLPRAGLTDATGAVKLPNPYTWQFFGKAISGTGVFSPSKALTNIGDSQDVALADVDGDGDLDIFIAKSDGNNQLWFNNNGAFPPNGATIYGNFTNAVVLNDFDRDGEWDVFLAHNGNKEIIYSFATDAPVSKVFSDTNTTLDVALGDFNNDGNMDVYAVNYGSPSMVWKNSGSSRNFITNTIASNNRNNQAVAVGDVNGDGLLDAVVVGNGTNEVQIGDGNGGFKYSGLAAQTLGQGNSTDVALADFNGDAKLDVIITNADQADQVWYNNGTGNFPENSSQRLTTSSQAVGVADVDADDDLDLYMAVNGKNIIWLNDPDKNGLRFTPGEPMSTNPLISNNDENSQAVAMGDVDGDGDIDAVVANKTANNVIWSNIPWPKLVISKATPSLVAKAGEKITYTFTITNIGSAVAKNVVITDKIPLGANYNVAVAKFDKTSNPLQLTQMGVNSVTQVSFSVGVFDTLTDTIVNEEYRVSSGELTRNILGTSVVTTRVEVPIRGLTWTDTLPVTGFVSTAGSTNLYTFSAKITPIFASPGVDYYWTSSGSPSSKTNPNAGASNQVAFSWTEVGTHVVTLTVENPQTPRFDPIFGTGFRITQTIVIRQRAIEDLAITGPETGLMGQSYSFTGTVSPSETTPPISYTWRTSEQPDLELSVDSLQHTVAYSWTTSGLKVITLTGANLGSVVTVTKLFTVQTPPAQVVITGPITGQVYSAYTFTGRVNPLTTTVPLTYIWEVSNQATPIYTQTNDLSDTLVISWEVAGLQVITLTAMNDAGLVSTTHLISTTLFEVCQPISQPLLTRLPIDRLSTDTQVQFMTTVTQGDPLSYSWSVNDVALSNEISSTLAYQFDTAMTYTVSVTIYNECSSEFITQEVMVEDMSQKADLMQSAKMVNSTSALPGDVLTYTLILRNVSDISATNVMLNDPIPANTIYKVGSAQANGQMIDAIPSAGPVSWTGEVISGTPVMVQFAVTVISITADNPISNVATVTYNENEVITLATESHYNNGYTMSINEGALFTNIPTVTLKYSWPTPLSVGEGQGVRATIIQAQFSNDGGFGINGNTVNRVISLATPNPNHEPDWRLAVLSPSDSGGVGGGNYVLPRLVYARYRDEFGRFYGPVVDDIIYDPISPTLDSVMINGAMAADFRERQIQLITLRLTVHDDNSGVEAIHLSDSPDFATFSIVIPVTATVEVPWTLKFPGKLYVRVKDRAGNMTVVETGAIPPQAITFSPVITKNVGQLHVLTLTANVSPMTTTLPLTYTWQATGHDNITTMQLSALTATTTITWPMTQSGPQTVTLTVMNVAGVITEVYTLTVPPSGIFLPIIMHK